MNVWSGGKKLEQSPGSSYDSRDNCSHVTKLRNYCLPENTCAELSDETNLPTLICGGISCDRDCRLGLGVGSVRACTSGREDHSACDWGETSLRIGRCTNLAALREGRGERDYARSGKTVSGDAG